MNIERVMVDSINYAIEKTDEMIVVDGRQCAADIDYNTGLIRISDKIYQSGAAAFVLMHEIVHAILSSRGMIENSDDEELVDALAAGFINLIRANPKLVAFITEMNHYG